MMPKFVPRQRKNKVRLRDDKHVVSDSNVTELTPVSKVEKEQGRQKLRDELRSQLPRISSKKQKRLDKYIDNKLKKDETVALLKKLAQSKTDVSGLQSSRTLGRKSLNSSLADQKSERYTRQGRDPISPDVSSDEESDDFTGLTSTSDAFTVRSDINVQSHANIIPSLATGSGLKRPLELGDDGLPMIATRKKRRRVHHPQEETWEGFRSGDEDQDSHRERSEGDNADTSDDSSQEASTASGSEDHDSGTAQKMNSGTSAFKAWATQQINESLDYRPSITNAFNTTDVASVQNFKPRAPENDPLPPDLQADTSKVLERKAFHVEVDRAPEVQKNRLELPIVAEEQRIMEAIHNNSSVVVWGSTGSGKTTQVPQFLFEAGYGDSNGSTPGMIGVTQPRRVAAVSMARRVSEELGGFEKRVSYQIRFESTASKQTAIKFMTDGILLREVSQDFALSKYSIIIIDEAHERSVNTDILIGMISRIVDLRAKMSEHDPKIKPLKFVIMSATLRIADFLQNPHLFRHGQPPLVQAEGRQYPVTVHFARRTNRDYVEEAFNKICKGHRKLPPGGFLVFLTGQNEIQDLARRLKAALATTKSSHSHSWTAQISASDAPVEVEDVDIGVNDNILSESEDSDVEIVGGDKMDDDREFEIGEAMGIASPIHVLPLYSQLPTKDQLRVFEQPPEGSRLIVIATNVAETSLTIPGIRYVFDCGRSKERRYDQVNGVQSFQIGWISKASASQRAGRAGRTGPGHCYRLYSSAVYERDFEEHTEPEILRTPIEEVVLQMKSIGLDNVVNFPFPTAPDRGNLARAETLLQNLGALSKEGRITDLGRSLTMFPVSPRYGKMLLVGNQHGCLPYVVALVASLSVSDLFMPENQLDMHFSQRDLTQLYTNKVQLEDDVRAELRKSYNRAHATFSKFDQFSDGMKMVTATCAYAFAADPDGFCKDMFLQPKAMKEALQLRRQLTDIIRANHAGILQSFTAKVAEPSERQVKALKQILIAGFIDQIAIRADLSPSPPNLVQKPKRSIDVPYLTLFPSHTTFEDQDRAVYIHPTSTMAHLSPKEMPQYIVYSHLQRSTPSSINSSGQPKVRMFPLTSASGSQLAALAHNTPLLNYGKPIGKITIMDKGKDKLDRRECIVVPSLMGEKGGLGWPLPARKVVQRREKGDWVIEKFSK